MVLCIYCRDFGIKTKYAEQRGCCVCALRISAAFVGLLVAADAAGKKRADLGNANVCASVQKRDARALIVSSICLGAVLLCAEIKDNFICEKNKSGRRHTTRSI